VSRSSKIVHLFIPKEFKVWCRPSKSAAGVIGTTEPSKTTCAVCLTNWRTHQTGKYKRFNVTNTLRD
jgi:hypothetical protein